MSCLIVGVTRSLGVVWALWVALEYMFPGVRLLADMTQLDGGRMYQRLLGRARQLLRRRPWWEWGEEVSGIGDLEEGGVGD